jgi:hypothetical protein
MHQDHVTFSQLQIDIHSKERRKQNTAIHYLENKRKEMFFKLVGVLKRKKNEWKKERERERERKRNVDR